MVLLITFPRSKCKWTDFRTHNRIARMSTGAACESDVSGLGYGGGSESGGGGESLIRRRGCPTPPPQGLI